MLQSCIVLVETLDKGSSRFYPIAPLPPNDQRRKDLESWSNMLFVYFPPANCLSRVLFFNTALGDIMHD
jgi:hypothetical protein